MSYSKRTCVDCGFRNIQPKMIQVERPVKTGKSQGSNLDWSLFRAQSFTTRNRPPYLQFFETQLLSFQKSLALFGLCKFKMRQTMFVAKPNLNDNRGMKQFPTKKEAVEYLEKYTGFEMSWERNKKTGEITYDWELIGKLYPA